VVEQPIRNRQVASSTLALGSTFSSKLNQSTGNGFATATRDSLIVPELSPFPRRRDSRLFFFVPK